MRTFGKILVTPLVRDQEFSSSKQVLEGKAKQLRLAGQGKRPNKARQVSDEAGRAENSEVKKPRIFDSNNVVAPYPTLWTP